MAQPLRVRGFEQDMTDQEHAREELARAERRYRSLVERLPAVSYVCNAGADGEWTYVSPQIERMLGYTPEEWIADPTLWERCVHPEDRERVVDFERHSAIAGTPMAIEYRMQARDGRTLWIRDEALVRTDRGGVLLRRDAHRHHRAQGVRDAAPVPCRPRSADRALQPPAVRGGAVPGVEARRTRGSLLDRRDARPRQLQVHQRLARPSRRRRLDPRHRRHAGAAAARDGHARPARWRRVRGAAARARRPTRHGSS